MFEKTFIFCLEYLLALMTNQPPNYQLLHGPSTDLEHVGQIQIPSQKEKGGGGVGIVVGIVVELEPPFLNQNVFTAKLSGRAWGHIIYLYF